MKLIYTLFYFLLPFFLFANNEIIKIYDYQLDLEGVDFYFERVIDARQEKGAIGFVQKGLNNKRSLAIFKDGIETEFLRLFTHNFPKKEKATPLIFKINQFVIYEETYTLKEVAIVEMNFTIFQKSGEEYITLFQSGNIQKKYGLDVTHFHSKNIVKGVTLFFQEFINAKKNKDLLNTIVNESVLLESVSKKEDFFIAQDSFEEKEVETIEIPSVLKKAGVVIYFPPLKKDLPVRILIYNEEKFFITSNEYIHINAIEQNQQINICVEVEGKKRCNMILAGLESLIFLKIVSHKRKGVELKMMDAEEGNLLVNGINSGSITLNDKKK